MSVLSPLDTTWLLFSAFLVMIMQAGFCLFETGLVRSKNSINVAFKNLSDFTISAMIYWLIGYGLMYGETISGIVGSSGFVYSHNDGNGAWFVYQLMFCCAAVTIVGGALAERTRFATYLLLSALIAGIIYPVVGHWIWGGALQSEIAGWLSALGFIDFAGGTAVHGVGGWFALAAVLIIGPRIGRFSSSPTEKGSTQIQGSNYPMASVGVILLWFGWFGFNAGSLIGYNDAIAPIVINTSLSAASGGITLLVLFLVKSGIPDVRAVLNGTLAGLVGITAGCHLFSAIDSVLVGALAALAATYTESWLAKRRIDDVISAFPVHGIGGLVGTLMVAILGDSTRFPAGHSMVEQLAVQSLGALAVAVWAFGAGYLLIYTLSRFLQLRVDPEAERLGLNVSEHNAKTDTLDLLVNMTAQREEGNFNQPVHVEPHTEVGQIASEYNQVLDRVRLEISTREEAYKQLKEASHFQYIFENTREGILQFSMDGSVQKVNPAAAAILGYVSSERLHAKIGSFMEKLSFNDKSTHEKLINTLYAQGQVIDFPLGFKREIDQQAGYAMCSIRTIAGNDELDPCYLVSLADLSDKKENEQLKVARDAAEEANKAKSQFLANMSHEIRTPLNGVTGMLELLSRSELQDHQQRYIDIAQNSAESLLSVINDILDFSKIEAGKMELDSVEFHFRDTLADVIDIFAVQAARKEIELIGDIPSDLPEWVIGDPERFRQVLINLLGNAVKFTESGTITLEANCTGKFNNLAELTIAVTDTGCGIDETGLDKLFHSFTQADASTTRKYGGTGLGLTISQQLVNMMKGSIDVKSELGVGSCFSVSLTLPVSERNQAPSKRLPYYLEQTRVLVVDDHPVNLKLVHGLLQPFGLKIDCVDSAAKALVAVDRANKQGLPYELLLLDYHMPETDGIMLAAKLRTLKGGKDQKIILLTSIDQINKTSAGAEYFDETLVKPVRASRLFDSIITALHHKKTADTTTLTTDPDNLSSGASGDRDKKTDRSSDNTGTDTSSVTVLLVEDNPVNQIVAITILEDAEYQVEVADDGQEAFDRVQQGGIDLILMDCQMPVLDGFEATRAIRQWERDNGVQSDHAIPIIALTANALKGDREACIDAGMNDYVTKPLDLGVLFSAMSTYVAIPPDADESSGFKNTGT